MKRIGRWVLERSDEAFRGLGARDWNQYGLNVARIDDFYSPLPVSTRLDEKRDRWVAPSDLGGVEYDLDDMRRRLRALTERFGGELNSLPAYEEVEAEGYGQGFHGVDAIILYLMLRELAPRRLIEVGSGVSSYFSQLALKRNAGDGNACHHTCIDPYPMEALRQLSGVELRQEEVQDVPPEYFRRLDDGDVLLIDTTHSVRIDGDTPFLHLEVLPRVRRGAVVHVHDIPFPYNIPFPADLWVLDREWPIFWNEAMLVQAFLSFNDSFEMLISAPLLHYEDERFLSDRLPDYGQLTESSMGAFSSLWLRRTK